MHSDLAFTVVLFSCMIPGGLGSLDHGRINQRIVGKFELKSTRSVSFSRFSKQRKARLDI